ncbi:DUF4974 domain-containing protein [Sphingobacterium sp. SGG-5]|uniref:FecR family protein n=1 Tax=Sphingobacterium sp. SGG-5 TaxID=2710881 RepID=UPI0013EB8726|nr:FecR domain-containing protein [Sphingobacterium sp. SGG-5]NGM60889.1 DUF4974 domain-containing protein [Sphingobacterium sp. SGG-5]
MDEIKIREILQRYQEGKASDEERAWVESWYLQFTDDADVEDLNTSDMHHAKRKIWGRISSARPVVRSKRYIYPTVAAAAAVLLLIGFAFYLFQDNTTLQKKQEIATQEEIIKPGGNNAYLTLADGKKINLKDMEEGTALEQAGMKIVKKSNGELVYEISKSSSKDDRLGSNTIETPVGGQYHVVLPDGTKVWLNSSSSLAYPVRFAANERKVKLDGEAYFEVQRDKKRPFRVISESQTVEVLGTKFNVNTYKDEPVVKTTLLEGSVRVSLATISKILRPGEQAAATGQEIQISVVDTDQAVAWYRGDFVFDGVELKNIMRQISRWYGVEVIYQNDIGDVKFGGSISRSKDIEEVLKVLAMTKGVNFKVEGRRVLVMR